MSYNGLTNQGLEYLTRCQVESKPVVFSKVKIGNGNIPMGSTGETTTDLYSFKKEIEILNKEQVENSIKMEILINNFDVLEEFYVKEIGVYVMDNDVEKLYWYINKDRPSPLPDKNTPAKHRYILHLETSQMESIILNYTGLDLMVDKEFVEKKIKEKVRTFEISTIAELQSRKNLKAGDIVEVLGYYTAGDGAGHKRIIANEDDGSGVQLANRLWANIIHNGEVNVSWFGAKGDGVTDDTSAFEKAINYKGIIIPTGTFIISKKLNLNDNLIIGSGKYLTSIKLSDNFADDYIFNYPNLNHGGMQNFSIYGNRKTVIGINLGTGASSESHVTRDVSFKSLVIEQCNNGGIHLNSNFMQTYFDDIFIGSCVDGIGFKINGNDCFFTNINVSGCLVGMDISTAASKFSNFKVDWCQHLYGSKEYTLEDSYGVIFRNVILSNFSNFEVQRCFANGIYIKRIVFSTLDLNINGNGSHEKIDGNYDGEWNSFGNQIRYEVLENCKINFMIMDSKHCLKNFNRVGWSSVENNRGTVIVENNGKVDDFFDRNTFMNGISKNIEPIKSIISQEFCPVNFLSNKILNTSGEVVTKEKNLFVVNSTSEQDYSGIALRIDKDKNYNLLPEKEYTFVFKVDYKASDFSLSNETPGIYIGETSFIHEKILFIEEYEEYKSIIKVMYFKPAKQENKISFNFAKSFKPGLCKFSIKNLFFVGYEGRIEDEYRINNIIRNNFYIKVPEENISKVQQLNTIYHLEKMKQENVYDDYITYNDEKFAYDKEQKEIEKQRMLSYQEALKENPDLTYEQFMSVQPMTLNLVEEPQPSEALKKFMGKYL